MCVYVCPILVILYVTLYVMKFSSMNLYACILIACVDYNVSVVEHETVCEYVYSTNLCI